MSILTLFCFLLSVWCDDDKPKALTVTIIHTTDVHGWVNGHTHQPKIDADFGDLYNFIWHMKQNKKPNEVVYAFDTGDLTQGTGLSDATSIQGEFIYKIVNRMNYDGLTIGNHELRTNGCIENIVKNVRPFWKGRYLGSNVRHVNSSQVVTDKYFTMNLPNGTGKVAVFGFLTSWKSHDTHVTVKDVNSTLNEDWVETALKTTHLKLIVCLCHIDTPSKEIDQIYARFKHQRPNVPIVFLTGHSHKVRTSVKGTDSIAMESGRYLNNVGVLRFQLPLSTKDSIIGEEIEEESESEPQTAQKISFSALPTAGSVAALQKAANVTKEKWSTTGGQAIKALIAAKSKELHLDTKLGCSKHHYLRTGKDKPGKRSLYRFIVDSIMPTYFKKHAKLEEAKLEPSVFLFKNGALRYDIYKGVVTHDDIYTFFLNPYQVEKIVNVPGDAVLKLKKALEVKSSNSESKVAYFFTNSTIKSNEKYSIFFLENAQKVIKNTLKQTESEKFKIVKTNIQFREVVASYVQTDLKCPSAESPELEPEMLEEEEEEDVGTETEIYEAEDDDEVSTDPEAVEEKDGVSKPKSSSKAVSTSLPYVITFAVILGVVGLIGAISGFVLFQKDRKAKSSSKKVSVTEIATDTAFLDDINDEQEMGSLLLNDKKSIPLYTSGQ